MGIFEVVAWQSINTIFDPKCVLYYVQKQSPMDKANALIGQHGIKFDNMVSVNNFGTVFCVMKENRLTGTKGICSQASVNILKLSNVRQLKNNLYDIKSWVHIFSTLFGSVVNKRMRG